MKCVYNYRGKIFDSELALDDFLLASNKVTSPSGDIVFEISSKGQIAEKNINNMVKVAENAAKTNRKAIQKYNEEGEIGEFEPPYIGVTEFLSGLTTDEGKIMFPEFREEEYWKRRFTSWKDNDYTNEEAELLFEGGETSPVINEEQAKKYAEMVEDKWEQQGVIGTVIHKIFQQCFKKNKDGKYYVDVLLKNPNSIVLRNNIPNDIKKFIDTVNNGIHADSKLTVKGRVERGRTPLKYSDVIPNEEVFMQILQTAKKLKDKLIEKYGNEDLIFYPEFEIVGNLNKNITKEDGTIIGDKIRGTIDLLIVDPNTGRMHIVDYKTSPLDYNSGEYSSAKILTFKHQLATYNRILGQYGVDFDFGDMMVVPIQIMDFKRADNRQDPKKVRYSYSSLEPNLKDTIFDDLTTEIKSDADNSPSNNVASYLDVNNYLDEDSDKALENVNKQMKTWFTNYNNSIIMNKETLIESLKEEKLLDKNEDGKYIYIKENGQTIISDKESEFIDKVFNYRNTLPKRSTKTKQVLRALQSGINGEPVSESIWPSQYNVKTKISNWFATYMAKYCTGSWEIIDNNILTNFGIIALRNVYSHQIDIIKITNAFINSKHSFGYGKKDPELNKRKGLVGKYELDIQEKSKPNSLMLEATEGNIELMETLVALNNTMSIFKKDSVVGNILVANPSSGKGVQASNEELLYCYKALNKYDKVENDNILSNRIKFATKYELVYDQLLDILALDELQDKKRFQKIESCKSILQQGLIEDKESKIEALTELLNRLDNNGTIHRKTINVPNEIKTLNEDTVSLYNNVLIAIANLKGVNFRQQLKDHFDFLESSKIFTEGLSGTRIDNNGNMQSETLNLVTKLVLEAYQNVRQDMQEPKYKYHELVKNLKRVKNFDKIKEYTIGNQVKLYSNMIEKIGDNELRLKNVNSPDLCKEEKDFLTYFLLRVNRHRLKATEDELIEKMNNDSEEFYRLPLQIGSLSTVSADSLENVLKKSIHNLKPSVAWERMREKYEGFDLQEEGVENSSNPTNIIYKMTNSFDSGEGLKRNDIIKEKGFDYFEQNLETVGLKHEFAYSIKENIDAIFPLIKAAVIHLSLQGSLQNTTFTNDLSYINDYVKANIKNENIIGKQWLKLAKVAETIKKAASTATLACSPVQGLYQNLQGLWLDISLMIRKPDGTDAFTFQHLKDARIEAYKDVLKDYETPSVCSELNELYGMNDMDMNSYSEKIQTDRHGIFNLRNFLFKFSSRPDYFNRSTIFGAQMRGDGSWEAHSIINGKLVYDWTKDKRFDVYAAGKIHDPKYNEQKSLYYAMAKQFMIEDAKYINGKEFKLNDNLKNPAPLPRAYTNQQAEGMKAVADNIYGYYSHEKKSLIHSELIGTMWMQFRTYWSSKKNQYLGSPGVKIQGKMAPYKETREVEENGVKSNKKVQIYYKLDKDGNPTDEMTEEDTGFKVYQWEGDWQEGIMVTLMRLLKSMPIARRIFKGSDESFKEVWKELVNNPDERLQRAYMSNIKQAVYDLSLFLFGGLFLARYLLGGMYDDLEKNSNKQDMLEGIKLSIAKIMVYSVQNSFQDFNAFDSILDPLVGWTPFSFEWCARTFPRLIKMLPLYDVKDKNFVPNEDIWDGIFNSISVGKQFKPFLDTIKPEALRYDE